MAEADGAALLKIVADMLEPDFVAARGSVRDHCDLREFGRDARLRRVRLQGLSGPRLVFLPDLARGKNARMSPLLAKSAASDHNKACDALLIHAADDSTLDIAYLELKSEDPKGFAEQFRSTRCFVRYLCVLIEEFHGRRSVALRERFVVLHCGAPSMNKRRSRPQRHGDQPQDPIFIRVQPRDPPHPMSIARFMPVSS